MPWKKPPEKPFVEMERLLKGRDINSTRLAAILGVSLPTARNKLENPGKLTLNDIDLIRRFGHIPVDEIRAAIKG